MFLLLLPHGEIKYILLSEYSFTELESRVWDEQVFVLANGKTVIHILVNLMINTKQFRSWLIRPTPA